MKRVIPLILCALLLTACGSEPAPTVPISADTSDLFTDRDFEIEYDESSCTVIDLTDSVTITEPGSYLLRGSLSDGQIIVDTGKQEKVQLILDGADITCAASAPIYIRQADKVFITLAGINTLTNGGTFEAMDGNNIDAVIFSKDDLTINGSGSLTIISPAGHGIVSKDELTVTGGSFDITCASHAVCGKDNLCIAGGSFTIAAGKDGLHAEHDEDASLGFVHIESGSFRICAEGDGIAASGSLEISGGTFDITAGGGWENGESHTSAGWGQMGGGRGPGGMGRPGSMDFGSITTGSEDSASIKGIKAGGDLTVTGGSFTLDCADDALHSNANMTILGGTFTIATGDDGLHADDTLTVENGTIAISESYEGLEALHIRICGGDISLVSSDDGLNAAGGVDGSGMGGRDPFGPGGMSASSDGSIIISGGRLYAEASGDGIDANGYLEITGGDTIVTGPTTGDTATLDYDTTAAISGGTFIGTGASGMAQTFSDPKQGVIAVSVGRAAAGTAITLTDAAGAEIISYAPDLDFSVVILSSPDMVSGESYTITVGTASGTFTAS